MWLRVLVLGVMVAGLAVVSGCMETRVVRESSIDRQFGMRQDSLLRPMQSPRVPMSNSDLWHK